MYFDLAGSFIQTHFAEEEKKLIDGSRQVISVSTFMENGREREEHGWLMIGIEWECNRSVIRELRVKNTSIK